MLAVVPMLSLRLGPIDVLNQKTGADFPKEKTAACRKA